MVKQLGVNAVQNSDATSTVLIGGIQLHDKSIPSSAQENVKKYIVLSLLPQFLVGI